MLEIEGDVSVPSSIEGQLVQPNIPTQPTKPALIIRYKEFKRLSVSELALIPKGTLIQDVLAKELFTLQDWIHPDKILRAARDFVNGRCTTWPLAYPIGLRGKPVLVLGDGTHRSGLVIANGLRVIDVATESPVRPMDSAKIRPLRAVVNRYRDLFGLEI